MTILYINSLKNNLGELWVHRLYILNKVPNLSIPPQVVLEVIVENGVD